MQFVVKCVSPSQCPDFISHMFLQTALNSLSFGKFHCCLWCFLYSSVRKFWDRTHIWNPVALRSYLIQLLSKILSCSSYKLLPAFAPWKSVCTTPQNFHCIHEVTWSFMHGMRKSQKV